MKSIIVFSMLITMSMTPQVQANFVGLGDAAATTALDAKPAWNGVYRGYVLPTTGPDLTSLQFAARGWDLTTGDALTDLNDVTLKLLVTDSSGTTLGSLALFEPAATIVDGCFTLLFSEQLCAALNLQNDLTGNVGVFVDFDGGPNKSFFVAQSDVSSVLSDRYVGGVLSKSDMALAMNVTFGECCSTAVPETTGTAELLFLGFCGIVALRRRGHAAVQL